MASHWLCTGSDELHNEAAVGPGAPQHPGALKEVLLTSTTSPTIQLLRVVVFIRHVAKVSRVQVPGSLGSLGSLRRCGGLLALIHR